LVWIPAITAHAITPIRIVLPCYWLLQPSPICSRLPYPATPLPLDDALTRLSYRLRYNCQSLAVCIYPKQTFVYCYTCDPRTLVDMFEQCRRTSVLGMSHGIEMDLVQIVTQMINKTAGDCTTATGLSYPPQAFKNIAAGRSPWTSTETSKP